MLNHDDCLIPTQAVLLAGRIFWAIQLEMSKFLTARGTWMKIKEKGKYCYRVDLSSVV